MIVSYNWLKEYLGDTAPSAEEVATLLTFHAFEIDGIEVVGDDTAIDVNVLPNRGSDCLCHRGIARDIASITGAPLVYDPLATKPALPAIESIAVTIEDEELCPRFTASLISGVQVGPSPQWLQDRLRTLGQRSINNIVDATNYVMYAIGQPLHAYDATKFPKGPEGTWQFIVRKALPGETVSLLSEGGKEGDRVVELKGGELLIVDGTTGTAIGLAGVKGGRFAGVDDTTTTIIVEAAHFHPTHTRITARGLGIVIDASKRFENEPARELPLYGQAEIITLITDIAGGQCEGVLDVYLTRKDNQSVLVRPAAVNARLGLALSDEAIVNILKRVSLSVEETAEGVLCTAPFERTDLIAEVDYIEEVGRLYGYEHVAAVIPEAVPLAEINTRHYYSEQIRETLLALGYAEVITSSFQKKDEVQLANALAADKTCLRSSLRKNIEDVLDRNAHFTDQLGTGDTRVFEIGTVFHKGEGVVAEYVSVAIGVRLRPSGYSGKEDKVLAAAVTALEASLGVTIAVHAAKGVAEFNLTSMLAALPVPTAYQPTAVAEAITYQAFSVYPAVSRDIAMWVDGEPEVEEIAAVLRAAAGPLLARLTHVDTFTKDGRTSLAFRLVFQSSEKTLTAEEVHSFMENVYQVAAQEHWEVR